MSNVFNNQVIFNDGTQTYGNAFVSGDLTADGNITGNVTSNSVNVSGVATITTGLIANASGSTLNYTGLSTITNISASRLTLGIGVTVESGIVTATNGFHSGIGTAVKVTTVGNRVFFTVAGVGVTSFQLY